MKNIIFVLLLVPALCLGQADSVKNEVPKGKIIANIYTGFYYDFLDNCSPRSGFAMSMALIGYSRKLAENVKATIIYDVTRTTNIYSITDSAGNAMNVDYFEGSKYTAFLKMAQIDWRFTKKFELSVGQLLSHQYLTYNDKFWGYRYIDVTFQEQYNYGMPADFGARITYYHDETFNACLTIMNGDGPFRFQDNEGLFLYSGNVVYKPVKALLFKVYGSYFQASTAKNEKPQLSFSLLAGYKRDRYKIGLEYNMIQNYSKVKDLNINGISLYASYTLSEKVDLLTRVDYGKLYDKTDNDIYVIAGVQYQPVKRFYTSVNLRYRNLRENLFVFANFGIKL